MEHIDPLIDDVWSRTAPKYRNRAVVLLLANMVLFGALCCFMFWLRTGWYFPPTYEKYEDEFRRTVRFTGEGQVTAYDLVTRPISLNQVPMQGVVVGLLLASLSCIPVLVSILYRLPAALPFCAMVGFLAVMPWLSANLVLACILAHYARKRLKFRFAAALLGLIPIGIYMFVSSRKYAAPQNLLVSPFEQGLVLVPVLISVVAACGLVACVLIIARLVHYRPGAITPLLALMFLAPWFLFMGYVGRDELHYRFLELHYGPKSNDYFAPADAGPAVRQAALAEWAGHTEPRPTIDVLEQKVRDFWDGQLASVGEAAGEDRDWLSCKTEFAREQHRVDSECDKFLSDFENSRYVPCVLYVKGRALDMRVDHVLFRQHGRLRYYDDFPSEVSRETWLRLARKYPESRLARIARLRLAHLDARNGAVDQAIRWLEDIESPQQPGAHSDAGSAPGLERLFAKKPPDDGLINHHEDLISKAVEFRAMLQVNRDPLTGDASLVEFLKCDPRHHRYQSNLEDLLQLLDERPDVRIRDNIEVRLALAGEDLQQHVRSLQSILQRHPESDTQPWILYELGVAYTEQGELTEARAQFQALYDRFPDSTHAVAARRKLVGPAAP